MHWNNVADAGHGEAGQHAMGLCHRLSSFNDHFFNCQFLILFVVFESL